MTPADRLYTNAVIVIFLAAMVLLMLAVVEVG